MKKSVTKNYIYNLSYQILTLLVPLATTPYISRVLGANNIGIYSYTLSISGYFIMLGSLGIALYGQREIAFCQNNKSKYSYIFWEIILLRVITMIVSLLVFYFIFVRGNSYQIYYQVLTLELIGNCIDTSWFFQGLEEFKKTVMRNILVKIISVACIFIFIKSQDDLLKYFIIYVLSIIIGNGSLWLYLPKFLEKIEIKKIGIFKHFKPTIALLIPQIAIQVYTLLDRTMIGAIINDKAEVGYYEQSQKIVKMLLTIITSLGTVMLPRIANTFLNGDKKKVSGYMLKSFNMVFFMAFPMIFGIIAVSDSFVPLFFGDGYAKVGILMRVISPVILLIGISNVTGTQYLLPTKRQKEFTISVTCGAFVNFIMNALLIGNFGAIGASIGTVIAELTVTSIQLYFIRKDFDLKKILRLLIKYFIAGLVMVVVCIGLSFVFEKGIKLIVVQVTSGIIVYILCLIILKDVFIVEVLNKAKNIIKIK